jgi:hypothetical protein
MNPNVLPAQSPHAPSTDSPRSPPNNAQRPDTAPLEPTTTKLARNVSPGLLARMKLFNQPQAPETPRSFSPAQIGRIAGHKIRELDEFHRDRRSFHIERRGTAWSGTSSQAGTPLIPQHTGDSVPVLVMDASPPSKATAAAL